MKPFITVLMADDHALVRQALCGLLSVDAQFKIIGQARNGREAVALAQALKPDVIVMDISMPVLNGIEAAKQILAGNPAAKIVILSAHSEDAYVERLSAIGVVGFLEKQTSSEVFSKAIKEAAEGRVFFSSLIKQRRQNACACAPRDRQGLIKSNATTLTAREREVLQLIAEGSANKQTASALSISVKTVEKHRQNLMKKLGVHHTAGLTRYAIVHGVIEGGVQV